MFFISIQHYGFLTPASVNRFYGNQSVLALYGLASYSWKNLTMMAGLRAEEALLDLEFSSLDTATKTTYFAVYPTLHMGLSSGNHEWQLNYSRRVNRPDVDEMNPVPEFRDPRNIFKGNPDLKPEDIHSVELGYSYHPKNLTLIPTLFYRYKVNGFTRVTSSLNDSVLVTTMDNLAKQTSRLGLISASHGKLGRQAVLTSAPLHSTMKLMLPISATAAKKEHFPGIQKSVHLLNITKTTLFQINGQYRSEAPDPSRSSTAFLGCESGLQAGFLEKTHFIYCHRFLICSTRRHGKVRSVQLYSCRNQPGAGMHV